MKLLKFHPLEISIKLTYTEFHEDSEFRHESSRNCDPRQIFKENLKKNDVCFETYFWGKILKMFKILF